jgi:LysR family transcriptional regulator, low CO2-responsive transcriptional regulator
MYSDHLRVFHAVARHGGYARAAREELFISQPAVSKHVQALEEEVGAKLFSRVGKRLELTEAGALVLQCAEQMHFLTEETRRAVRELQGLQRGTLRVGTSTTAGTYLLPPYLATFAQRYPGVTLSLDFTNSQGVIAGMLERKWDLGVAGHIADHPQLEVQAYSTDPLVLIVPPQHRLATLSPVALADLAHEAWVLREPGSASRYVVEQALQTRQVPWQLRLALPSNEAIKQAVMAGIGIGMVSRLAVTLEVQDGRLRMVPVCDLQVERQFSIIQRKEARLPAPADAFLRLLYQKH